MTELEKAAVEAHKRLSDGDGLSFLNMFKAGVEFEKKKAISNAVIFLQNHSNFIAFSDVFISDFIKEMEESI